MLHYRSWYQAIQIVVVGMIEGATLGEGDSISLASQVGEAHHCGKPGRGVECGQPRPFTQQEGKQGAICFPDRNVGLSAETIFGNIGGAHLRAFPRARVDRQQDIYVAPILRLSPVPNKVPEALNALPLTLSKPIGPISVGAPDAGSSE